jgi:hypothetical protein
VAIIVKIAQEGTDLLRAVDLVNQALESQGKPPTNFDDCMFGDVLTLLQHAKDVLEDVASPFFGYTPESDWYSAIFLAEQLGLVEVDML